MKRYEKRSGHGQITATQINLELDGGVIAYRKWGGEQWAKQGDWLAFTGDDTYTIDAEFFSRTYKQIGPGQYVKTAEVWAEQATSDGQIETKEGKTAYSAGDMLVYNQADRGDGYAMAADAFHAMYVESP